MSPAVETGFLEKVSVQVGVSETGVSATFIRPQREPSLAKDLGLGPRWWRVRDPVRPLTRDGERRAEGSGGAVETLNVLGNDERTASDPRRFKGRRSSERRVCFNAVCPVLFSTFSTGVLLCILLIKSSPNSEAWFCVGGPLASHNNDNIMKI